MANFTFLNTVGTGPDVEDDEQDRLEAHQNEQAQAEYAGAAAANPKPMSDTKGDFQKKRAQAGDHAKKQSLAGLDRLSAAHDQFAQRSAVASEGAGAYPDFDYDNAKSSILAAPPEGAAQALYEETQKHPWLPTNQRNEILRPAEDAVTAYKRMLLENQTQEGMLQGQVTQQDAPQIQAHIQSLDQQIQRTQQDMALAATGRQKDELKGNLQWFSSQRANLASKLPPEQEDPNAPKPDKNVSVDALAASAGTTRRQIVQSMTELVRMAGTHGLAMTAPVTASTFPIMYSNMIQDFFNQKVAAAMLRDVQGPPKKNTPDQGAEGPSAAGGGGGGGSGSTPQDKNGSLADQTVNRGLNSINTQIQQHEARQRQVWQKLAHSGNFNSVFDMLGFVVCSFLVGPRNAANLFSNMHDNGTMRSELDMLKHETMQLYRQQDSYIKLAQTARTQAAQNQYERDHLTETHRHNLEMESAAGARYNSIRGKQFTNPETQTTYNALVAGERLWAADAKSAKTRFDDHAKLIQDPREMRAAGFTKESHAKELQKRMAIRDAAADTLAKRRKGLQKFILDHQSEMKGTPLNEHTFEGEGTE